MNMLSGVMGQGGGSTIIMLVVMIAVFYFLLIRPENKRKKEAEQMRSAVKNGDQITTIGGIVGKIVSVGEETLVIETSDDRVRIELTKWAVSVNNTQQKALEAEKAAKKNAKAAKKDDTEKK